MILRNHRYLWFISGLLGVIRELLGVIGELLGVIREPFRGYWGVIRGY